MQKKEFQRQIGVEIINDRTEKVSVIEVSGRIKIRVIQTIQEEKLLIINWEKI